MHGHEDPPGVTAASELLCPPVLATAGRAEGVGLRAANARVGPEPPPAFLEPSLRVSQGNRHSEQGSGLPGSSGSTPAFLSTPACTSLFDHLRSALRSQANPAQRGAPFPATGPLLASRAFCRRRSSAQLHLGGSRPGRLHQCSQENFPESRCGLGAQGTPPPPAGFSARKSFDSPLLRLSRRSSTPPPRQGIL